ncbi:MAG: HDOD domain-containing protein [Spirochaetales bacterium]|nr:HDOD domain-containing protein [Spirochaetales bacterium]MCF7938265.1 HDOD domain-containing protein [Spirochaetales bacterium]
MNDQMEDLKKYIQKMPNLPVTVTKVIDICNDPKASPNDLNKVISIDPVLMGRVMKLINSAYYGLNDKITSLVRAIIMLGLNTVKNLALSTAVLGNLNTSERFQTINMEGFWRHSLCVGVTARMIAVHRGVDSKLVEGYFVAGLLHDVGKIPLNNVRADDYIVTMAEADRQHLPLYRAEEEIFDFTHSAVGGLIAEYWNLGQEIRDIIVYHHDPDSYEGNKTDMLKTIAAANYFANAYEIGFSGDRYPEILDAAILDDLGIDWDFLDDLEENVNGEIEKAKVFLET